MPTVYFFHTLLLTRHFFIITYVIFFFVTFICYFFLKIKNKEFNLYAFVSVKIFTLSINHNRNNVLPTFFLNTSNQVEE